MSALDVLTEPFKLDEPADELVRRLHRELGGTIPVRLWDGSELGPPDPPFRLVLNHPWSLRSMLLPPTDLAAGEAYVFGDIDVEGSMIDALHTVARLMAGAPSGLRDRVRLARELLSLPAPPPRDGERRARLSGRRHSAARDSAAVRFHYDTGNDFYRLFLDREMVYSCAYFAEEDGTAPGALDRAQVRKLDLVCRKLHLQPGERLLDVGCGWGALLIHAATHYGVEAVGITLSPEQAALARQRIDEAGLGDRIEVRVQDYREVSGTFDAVASIGMFEHVGERNFTTYFDRLRELTGPGGRFLNHAITTGQRGEIRELSRDRGSFVGAYVFPDGCLAPAHVAARLMEESGFELIDVEQLRPHYARTLRQWVANLEANAEAAHAAVSEQTYRIWRAYMSGSVVGFETGDLGVAQVLGAAEDADLPLGRRWMLPERP